MQNAYNLIELIFKDKEKNVNLWETLKNLLNNNKDEIINFCNIMKNKISFGNKSDILYALNLIDFEVDNGTLFLWENIDSIDFLSAIKNIIYNNPDPDLQSVSLYLINKLADKFKNIPQLQNSVNLYRKLKKSNINFPNSLKYSYKNILQKSKTFVNINHNHNLIQNNNVNNNQIENKDFKTQYIVTRKSRIPSNPEDYITNFNLNWNENNFGHKYKRLVNKLNEIIQLIKEINIMIEKKQNFNNEQNLNDLYEKLKKDQLKIIACIEANKLENETVMSICINVNEDIIMTCDRYSKFIKGENPGPFLTSFSRNNNPYLVKNQIKDNKTVVFGDNKSNKMDDIKSGNIAKSIYPNGGFLENSLNIMFGNIEKSEVINNGSHINKFDENKHFINEMSQVGNNGNFINNQNESLLNGNSDFLNNSNLMIIGNKMINNNINLNNNNFNNNFINQNFIENQGNRNIYNNFLLNNNTNKNNNMPNNFNNNNMNTQMNPYNNINNNPHINNNINKNNSIHNNKNIYKTQFISNPYNLNNM